MKSRAPTVSNWMKLQKDKKISDKVQKGDILAYVHANDEEKGKEAVEKISKKAIEVTKKAIEKLENE